MNCANVSSPRTRAETAFPASSAWCNGLCGRPPSTSVSSGRRRSRDGQVTVIPSIDVVASCGGQGPGSSSRNLLSPDNMPGHPDNSVFDTSRSCELEGVGDGSEG